MSRPFSAPIAIVILLGASAARGHEFWIEPELYTVVEGDTLAAAIRVGENFNGASRAYLPRNFHRFDMTLDGRTRPVNGRPGDRPAAVTVMEEPGLAILTHVTRAYDLTYSSWDSFTRFVTSKDAEWVLDAHAERGFSEEPPTESYTRYAKSLIAVGGGAGTDRRVGLVTEIVALENPYTDDMSDGIDVQLFYDAEPRGDAQIDIFAKDAEGNVERTKAMTDKSGLATIPVTAGHSYLVNSVTMRAAEQDMWAQWESLWASLTFAIPE